MADGATNLKDEFQAKAWSTPLEDFHPGDPELFLNDAHWPYFERLRAEDPVSGARTASSVPIGR